MPTMLQTIHSKPAAPLPAAAWVWRGETNLPHYQTDFKRCTGFENYNCLCCLLMAMPQLKTQTYFRANDLDKKLAQEYKEAQKLIRQYKYSDAEKKLDKILKNIPTFTRRLYARQLCITTWVCRPKPCPL